MTTLSDQIDQLSRNTRVIRSITSQTASFVGNSNTSSFGAAGPFTNAVLNTDLGDLIRDIDPSELGLFTLLTPPRSHPREHDRRPREVSRADFPGATPLRKVPSRRGEALEVTEIEPETYAQAALKYLDRYEPIRSMPRAHSQITAILERLSVVRQSIQYLSTTLSQTQGTEYSIPQPEEEERQLRELHLRLAELKRRKHVAASQKINPQHNKPTMIIEKSNRSSAPASPCEGGLWNTPTPTARTLHFSDNLLDDNLDLNDITTTSFTSPVSATPDEYFHHQITDHSPYVKDIPPRPHLDIPATGSKDISTTEIQEEYLVSSDSDRDNEENDNSLEVSSTAIFDSSPPSPYNNKPELPPSTHDFPETPRPERLKIKINNEVERIVEKIWSAAGDLVMPARLSGVDGHDLSTIGPRKAKEVIARLQTLSALPLVPDSPAASSDSMASVNPNLLPTTQQILTAHLLLALLMATPHFSLPLNQVKHLLTSKAVNGLVSAHGTTRIIYGCVARRLIRIERGGGEQIVKFDI